MIALPASHSFRKLSLSYEFLATSPNFFDPEPKVMLKEITAEKRKTYSAKLPGKCLLNQIMWQDKAQDICNEIYHCLNSQKDNLSFDLNRFLL